MRAQQHTTVRMQESVTEKEEHFKNTIFYHYIFLLTTQHISFFLSQEGNHHPIGLVEDKMSFNF